MYNTVTHARAHTHTQSHTHTHTHTHTQGARSPAHHTIGNRIAQQQMMSTRWNTSRHVNQSFTEGLSWEGGQMGGGVGPSLDQAVDRLGWAQTQVPSVEAVLVHCNGCPQWGQPQRERAQLGQHTLLAHDLVPLAASTRPELPVPAGAARNSSSSSNCCCSCRRRLRLPCSCRGGPVQWLTPVGSA